jgi:hypothetical protein
MGKDFVLKGRTGLFLFPIDLPYGRAGPSFTIVLSLKAGQASPFSIV